MHIGVKPRMYHKGKSTAPADMGERYSFFYGIKIIFTADHADMVE